MPTICKTGTCRNKAVYGFERLSPLFCSTHREPNSKNTRLIQTVAPIASVSKICKQCSNKNINSRYKGYCTNCYVKMFPLDPLSLQTKYKSKDHIIRKYIDSIFDGFVHEDGCSKININNMTLNVVYDMEKDCIGEKTIFIKFNPDKYAKADGSYLNPLLYTRLPTLEREIARQFERIVNKENREQIEIVELYIHCIEEFSDMNFSK